MGDASAIHTVDSTALLSGQCARRSASQSLEVENFNLKISNWMNGDPVC